MSSNPKDPGFSAFVIPTLEEIINMLAETTFDSDLMFIGGDLAPATIFNGYRSGIFPMPLDSGQIGWFCPQRRGVFLTAQSDRRTMPIKISRSLRKSIARFTFSVDKCFERVISLCAQGDRGGNWISPEIKAAYLNLYELGWAHSFESWIVEDGSPVLGGGLYGISLGGLFAGESMFYTRTDGSKAALAALASAMVNGNGLVIDAQWQTPHLSSLGCIELPRSEYLELLMEAQSVPLPTIFTQGPTDLGRLELPKDS